MGRSADPKNIDSIPRTHPLTTPEQDLMRLKHILSNLPTTLLKHTHLSKVRREDPNLFFRAMRDDLVGL